MSSLPPDLAAAVRLGGETGRLFAAFDWASHPLGDPTGWSERWRGAVATALSSRFPTVLWLGPDMFLVYNDAYLPILGDKHPASLGAPGHEVWAELWDVIGPMLEGVFASGVATWSDDLMLPVQTAERPQERYFTFTYSPLLAETGRVDGIFCAVAETTEKVLGARRLHVLNDLAAALMDAHSVDTAVAASVAVAGSHAADLPLLAVYLAGPKEVATLRGSAGTAALREGVFPSLESWGTDGHVADVVRLEELGSGAPPVARAKGRGECVEEAVVRPIAPSPVLRGTVVMGVNPRRPLDDQYSGFCARFADQLSAALATAAAHEAERRRAEALTQLDAAKTAFLANVSHEFRTPLTLMLGPIEELMARAGTDQDSVDLLAAAHRSGRRLLRMVNTLLDFTRIEAGEPHAHLVTTDVGRWTAEIASSFAGVCERAGISLVLCCEPVAGDLDAGMWETIVLNLVSNAFKFTLEGSITVAVAPGTAGGALVTVADTGSGIAKEVLGRVFDRFYRPSGSKGRSVEGSGIGLALVQSLVALHHGSIDIESEPGAGTTVTVLLPPPAAAAPAGDVTTRGNGSATSFVDEALGWLDRPGSTVAPDRTGRPLVLVVDDNADMRHHLERILGARFDVASAPGGAAALTLARAERPDLVVTDVMMPALDGMGLVAALRSDAELATIPIVMLSARAGADAEGEGLGAGADDYLVKPFLSAELLNRVQARLDAAGRVTRGVHDSERIAASRAQLAEAVASARSIDDVLHAILAVPDLSLGAPGAALGVLATDEDLIRMRYAGAVDPFLAARYHVIERQAPVPMATAIREDRVVAITDRADGSHGFELDPVAGASLNVPVPGPAGLAGGMGLMWPEPRSFSAQEVALAAAVAPLIGSALTRIKTTADEHRLASELQDRLLALDVRAACAVVCAHYQSASGELRVGGDWFTASTIDDARLAISVGDVVGHGMSAVATMSQLRSALASAAVSHPDPDTAMAVVERYAATLPGAVCATVAYAVFDARTAALRYSCAGHPYPLVISGDGSVGFLEDGRRPPLATTSFGTKAAWGEASLPAGSLLVLYTDGLIERRDESLDAGLGRLAELAGGVCRLPAGDVCKALVDKMAPDNGFADDVVVVAVRPKGETAESFVDLFVAALAEVGPARHRLRHWLERLGLSGQALFDVLLAVGEAVNNAIEHGGALDRERYVTVEAFTSSDVLTVTVGDPGRWSSDTARSSRVTVRGRGLKLMHGLSAEVSFARSESGTRVTLHFALSDDEGRCEQG